MESKPFASLTSGLLARKGQAKPAMRPQAYGTVTPHDDLGWNDMGTAALSAPAVTAPIPHVEFHAEVPEPVRQQAVIAEELGLATEGEPAIVAPVIEAVPAPAPEAAVVLPVSRVKAGSQRKAAFTLRLDGERHLRLRLACAVRHRSAQAIVTEALDEFLKSMPELEDVARSVAQGRD